MEDNDRFVDELLDSALAHQRRAEPHPGFEGRIMERVHAAASERDTGTNVWKLWVAAAATAAVVVTFVAIYVANRSPSPAPQISQAGNAVSAPTPTEKLKANSEPIPAADPAPKVPEPKRVARRERKPSRRAQVHHWPSQFPTPAPLTPEEKALVRYVQRDATGGVVCFPFQRPIRGSAGGNQAFENRAAGDKTPSFGVNRRRNSVARAANKIVLHIGECHEKNKVGLS